MTDKQIIIDNVDVSGCNYYADGKCTNSQMIQSNCKNVAVCYYKEYKRKEQECDMWKNLTVDNGAVALKYQQQLDQLKAKNDELKKEIYKLNSTIDFMKVTEHSAINKYNKFKQTLTEIKDIVKNMNEECFYGDFKCEDCDFKNGCTYQAKKQLKQKISGVLGDNL